MAKKSRVKGRYSKRKLMRKRNTRRNKKTGGGYLYNIIDSVGYLRTLNFTEPNKVYDAEKMFNTKLTTFKTGLSKIKNLPLLDKFLMAIDDKRHSGIKNNNIFQLADLETAVDNRILDVKNYGKRNDRSIDQETARAIYGDNFDEPEQY